MSLAEPMNRILEEASPALAACLSEVGRGAVFPPDIPFQAAEAREARYNGTIGQITDGGGKALALGPIAAALGGLDADDRNRALLYSPVSGLPELRQRWRQWQRHSAPQAGVSSLPLVTVGLTHGLSLAADLFAGPGRPVAVPAPFWGNYRQTFALRTGARVVSAPAYRDGAWDPRAVAVALAGEPAAEPAVAILNLPSNPGGYSPTDAERAQLVQSLAGVADERPLVVLCDDAYAGLVYEDGISARSMFWDLQGVHPELVPVKIDGGTKEFSLFGGRVGFLTFPFEPESEAAAALESKVQCLVRAAVGSPVATTQQILLEALRRPDVLELVADLRRRLRRRYETLRTALAAADPELLRPLPFNSGCFALIELPEGVDSELVRRHLLAHHSTGLIAQAPKYLRIAFCSIRDEDLTELVRRMELGVREVAAG